MRKECIEFPAEGVPMEALKEKQQVDLIHCTNCSVETEINKFLRKVVIGT